MTYTIFDIETFKDFTCVCGIDRLGEFRWRSDGPYSIQSWFDRASKGMLVGYNNANFDNVILAHLLNGNKLAFDLAQKIIEGDRDYIKANRKYLPYGTMCYDLMNNKSQFLNRSLKECEMLERWDVAESTVPFSKVSTTREDREEIIKYCFNDCRATKKLFEKYCAGDLEARSQALTQFKIPKSDWFKYMILTPGTLAERLLGKCNGDAEMNLQHLKPLVSPILHDTIDYCESAGKLARDRRLLVDVVEIPQMGKVKIGTGGFHWALENYTFVGEKDGDVVNLDVDSMYPSMIAKFRYPTWTDRQFSQWDDLIAVKRNPTLPKAAKTGAKLLLNSITGKYNDRYSDSFCPTANLMMCCTGQVLILDLAIALDACGCVLIQANTDAVTFLPRGDWRKAKSDWETRTGLILGDGDMFKSIYQKAVNDYIATTESGNGWKVKGDFFKGSGLPGAKAWSKEPHVVTRAFAKYVLKDETPIIEEMQMTPEHTVAGEKKAANVKKYDSFVPKAWKVFYHGGNHASQSPDFKPSNDFLNERYRALIARWEGKHWDRIGKSDRYYSHALYVFSVMENPWTRTKEIAPLPDNWELMLKSLAEASKLPEKDFLSWLECVDEKTAKKARTAYYGMSPVSPRAKEYIQELAGVNQKHWAEYQSWKYFSLAENDEWTLPAFDKYRPQMILEWWSNHKGYCPSEKILQFYGLQFASMASLTRYLKKPHLFLGESEKWNAP